MSLAQFNFGYSFLINFSTRTNLSPPDLGSVLKATWLTDPITNAMQPILVEQLNVAVGDIGDDLSVNFLAFERTTDPVSGNTS